MLYLGSRLSQGPLRSRLDSDSITGDTPRKPHFQPQQVCELSFCREREEGPKKDGRRDSDSECQLGDAGLTNDPKSQWRAMTEVYFSPSQCVLFVPGTQAAGAVPESLLSEG